MKKFLKVTVHNVSLAAAEQPTNKWLDNSFSLSDWPAEDSIDQDTLKKNNKLVKKNKAINDHNYLSCILEVEEVDFIVVEGHGN